MKIWYPDTCEGVTLDKNQGGCSFVFPEAPGHVNYLLTEVNPDKVGGYLTAQFDVELVSGRPEFVSLDETHGLPPNVHVMFERKDDNMRSEFGRYWCQSMFVLGPIKNFAIVCALKPDLWTDVYGKSGREHLPRFNDAIKNIGKVGLTFGGGNSFGHGLYVKGGVVRFNLKKFKLH